MVEAAAAAADEVCPVEDALAEAGPTPVPAAAAPPCPWAVALWPVDPALTPPAVAPLAPVETLAAVCPLAALIPAVEGAAGADGADGLFAKAGAAMTMSAIAIAFMSPSIKKGPRPFLGAGAGSERP